MSLSFPWLYTVLPLAVDFTLICLSVGMGLALLRLLRGPCAQDRILALDTLYGIAMLMTLTRGILHGSRFHFDIALLIALFGFVSSAALAKFLLRGEVIEP